MTNKQLLQALQSADKKEIKKALSALKVDGNSSVIHAMIALLKQDEMSEFHADVIELLSSLKDTSSPEVVMEALRSSENSAIRQILLSTVWNSPLDYSPYFADFVLIASEGNFMEALDSLTILENMPGPFEERHVLEAQWHLKEYLEDAAPKEEKKAKIMSEIALLVKDVDRSIDGY